MNASRLPAARRRTFPPSFIAVALTGCALAGCIAPTASQSPGSSVRPSNLPGATATVGSATPSSAAATPSAGASGTPGPGGTPLPSPTNDAAATATQTARAYLDALVDGHYGVAWKLLSAQSQKHWKDKNAFADERGAFYATAGATYVLTEPDGSESARNNWVPEKFDGIRGLSYVIQVDHPALAGNNAEKEVFVVAPMGLSADWKIWIVR